MRKLTEPTRRDTINGWGQSSWRYEALFEVEEADVGTERPHYLGHNHRKYKFTAADVGCKIEVLTDASDWTCWTFAT